MESKRVQFEIMSMSGPEVLFGRVVDTLINDVFIITESIPERLIRRRVDQVQLVPEYQFPAPE